MQLSKKEYATKRIHYGCEVLIENPSLMQNSYPRDGIFSQHLTTIKDSYSVIIKSNYDWSNAV